MVTSSKNRWILPKGNIEAGESALQAALRETLEEAGIHATPDVELGTYYDPSKEADMTFFLAHFDRHSEHWLESQSRQRRWVPLMEAKQIAAKKVQAPLLDAERTLAERKK
jgi:diphosphoinositol-polyphosphate diphosphatase